MQELRQQESEKPVPARVVPDVTIPDVWREHPEIIYRFMAESQNYEQLSQEVRYVLTQKLNEEGIEFSSISHRTKDLNSFLEKVKRKNYRDPFKEVKDFAGVRVVCVYPSDLKRIEEMIRREFEVIEKKDKYSKHRKDRFGYMAVHFVIKLGEEFSGARYDHLKDLVCEIQTRTVLQHAWAMIDQHLVYKKQSSVPEELRAKINSLSRVLEEADRQFEQIRRERAEYIKSLEKNIARKEIFQQEINLDSLKIFCEKVFPEYLTEDDDQNFIRVLKWLDQQKYHNLGDLQKVVKEAAGKIDRVVVELELMLEKQGRKFDYWTNLQMLHISLAIVDSQYRRVAGISREFLSILEGFDKGK